MINMMTNAMINIVIPMAGLGSRFTKAGFKKPKPFIDVGGKPMILRVLENLSYPDAHFILIAKREHMASEVDLINDIKKRFHATFIPIDRVTEGTACTVLYAHKLINNNEPLLIANSDQVVDLSLAVFIEDCLNRNLDGSILTFEDIDRNPKWSFAKINSEGLVEYVREKSAVSQYATVGIYLFRNGSLFVDAAIQMLLAQDKVNEEYYTCPTYNYLINDSKRIGIYNIDSRLMHGLGTPEDLKAFLDR
jgi:NDP-sugar pyrophosphorylase family protein